MAEAAKISPDLQARLDATAERLGVSSAELVADALERGRSLDWQDRFFEKVTEGPTAADRGDFASDEEILRVLHKHRPR